MGSRRRSSLLSLKIRKIQFLVFHNVCLSFRHKDIESISLIDGSWIGSREIQQEAEFGSILINHSLSHKSPNRHI